ncbi:hypothetical protein [Vallitalea maricola]|uniref:Uncharacterized protein n=1 Tax=Vallitalea maricola TaxID=3074433 RepID=A0ACB5UJV9_9FIRM|nr:hypothetical protein AN2V17_22790 [Vallitalea sp. AN17-2]
MRKIISLILMICFFALPFSSIEFAANDNKVISLSDVDVMVFENGSNQLVETEDQLTAIAENIDICFENGQMNLKMNIKDNFNNNILSPINISLDLYPSQSVIFKDNAIIGIPVEISENYQLMSCRIENNSSSYTLLKPNIHMEGSTVLSIGLLDKKSNDIYYIQEEVNEINYHNINNEANVNFNKHIYSDQDLMNIELDYFSLKTNKVEKEEVLISENNCSKSVEFNSLNDNEEYMPLDNFIDILRKNKEIVTDNGYITNSEIHTTKSLVYRVDDSIFKSGSFDKWYHDSDLDATAPYAYSYITYHFAGTDNRLTYLVYLDIPKNINFSSQSFSIQLTVRDNVSVLYNVYNKTLGFFGDDNRIDVEDIKLTLDSDTDGGVIIKRYYTHYKKGSLVKNVVRAIIDYIPYVSSAVGTIEKLTASSDTKTNKWYSYHDTAEAQSIAYNGTVVDKIQADFKEIIKKDDYALLWVMGDSIDSINSSFKYTANYN